MGVIYPSDPEAYAKVEKVVYEFWDCFNVPGRKFGSMVGVLHTVTMEDTTPVY